MHQNFGIEVINQIKSENPRLWDASMKDEANQMILSIRPGGVELVLKALHSG